jgi:osmotically-inducible protein OsmY
VVTLSGTVASAEEKQLAEQLARNTRDVKDVNNKLAVRTK